MRRSKVARTLRAPALLLATLVLLPVSRVSAGTAPGTLTGAAPALLSLAPLPAPIPVKRSDYRTISWISYADYQYTVNVSYTRYGGYLDSVTTLGNATSGDAFQYGTLKYAATFSTEQLDQVRRSINAVTKGNPNFGNPAYTFSFEFWGHTDVRCDATNDWNESVTDVYGVADPCAAKYTSFTEGTFSGSTPNSVAAPFTKNYANAKLYRYTPGNSTLALKRAKNLRDQVEKRYEARRLGGDWTLVQPYANVYGAGEWFSWSSAAHCNRATANCAPERIAELIIVQTFTFYVDTTEVVNETEVRNGTTSSVVSAQVNCEYYNTCLDQPDFSLTQPAIKLSALQQQGVRNLTIPAASVSCRGCKAPVSAGAPTTGWVATVESATLSGVSLTPPSGYTSPKHYTFKSPPTDLTRSQKLTFSLKAATRAKAPYKLAPGTVSATIRLDPWLWDGQKLTWLTDDTVSVEKTAALTCSISTSCTFGVLGSNTVG